MSEGWRVTSYWWSFFYSFLHASGSPGAGRDAAVTIYIVSRGNLAGGGAQGRTTQHSRHASFPICPSINLPSVAPSSRVPLAMASSVNTIPVAAAFIITSGRVHFQEHGFVAFLSAASPPLRRCVPGVAGRESRSAVNPTRVQVRWLSCYSSL